MTEIKKGLFDIRMQGDFIIEVVSREESSQVLSFEIVRKKESATKKGFLFTLLALFFSGDLDFDKGNERINRLKLKESLLDNELIYRRVRKGVEIKEGDSDFGSVKFEKRKFICDYSIVTQGSYLGTLTSSSVSFDKLQVSNKLVRIARLQKSKRNKETIGTIELFEDLSRNEFKVLFGAVFFWV